MFDQNQYKNETEEFFKCPQCEKIIKIGRRLTASSEWGWIKKRHMQMIL